jgi:phage FluMu protein Com
MASENNSEIVRCNNCRTVLDENSSIQYTERTPCPVCSSLSRYYEKLGHAKLGLAIPETRIKGKRHGKGKSFIEQHTKHELYQETGEGRDVVRIIDRENNLYEEIIKVSKTGEIVCECCEPLDKHVGHGYAKLATKKGRDSKRA